MIVCVRVSSTSGLNPSIMAASRPHDSKPPADPNQDYWRDTDIRIEGPAVAQLQRIFLATWK